MADTTADETPATTTDETSDDTPGGAYKALQAERKLRRDAEHKLKQAQARVSELETAELRRDVATDKGIPADLLQGSTREELEAHADKLAAFRGDTGRTTSRPREALRPGASPEPDDEADMGKVADRILNRGI